MKKIFLVLSLLLIMSCVSENKNPDKSGPAIYEFEYKGHHYLRFELNAYKAGAVHDPDCPCFKGE